MSDKKIILNRIQTPDGTILTSRHVHDYVTYLDNNGEEYMVDGGHEYLRRNVTIEQATELSVFDDASFEVIRESYEWGTYGKDGKQPLNFVAISKMSDAHINALINTNYIPSRLKDWLETEAVYRIEHNITIID